MTDKLKPGEEAPKTGDYTVVGPRGGVIKTGVTVKKGDTMPPTPKKNQTYKKQ
ncbi:YjzC family protein [Paenibacillus sp. FSL L8-0708]|uniref:YjzC family protein n=1 Tax=Paenibacillus sp. FSL L8-0708 TaxID=2975311 RepID=UPI0030F516A5